MNLPEPRWTQSLPTKFVCDVATLGPLGLRLPAPGTWGSLAGLLYTMMFFYRRDSLAAGAMMILGLYVAVAFCGDAARRMGRSDPGVVVLDEFMAMPLCFLFWRGGGGWPDWFVLLAGFALFRFYDILKPFGIARLQKLPGGWGIVIDDAAAALATCATLHIGAWIWALR